MTKFEQVGINYQYDAVTPDQAKKSFQHSCTCCCHKGMIINCDRCAIATVHNIVMAYFDTKESQEVCKQ